MAADGYWSNAEYIALAGRIRQSLPDLRRLVARAELLMGKAQQISECFAVIEEDLLTLCRVLERVSAGDIDQ